MKRTHRKKDIIGQKINNWLILEKSNKSYYYKCQCICGKIKDVYYYSLKSNNSISCGCIFKEDRIKDLQNFIKSSNKFPNQKENGVAAFNECYNNYRTSAKTRKLEFNLSKEQFKKITEKNCYYCNTEPKQFLKSSKIKYGNYIHNGIDRKDNKVGYTLENSLPCCSSCNYLKRDLEYNEFINRINKICENLKSEEKSSN